MSAASSPTRTRQPTGGGGVVTSPSMTNNEEEEEDDYEPPPDSPKAAALLTLQQRSSGVANANDTAPTSGPITVFFGHLPPSANEAYLRAKLAHLPGMILKISCPTPKHDNPDYRYAFVTFQDMTSGMQAIKTLNGVTWDTFRIHVDRKLESHRGFSLIQSRVHAMGAITEPIKYKEPPSDKTNSLKFIEICKMLNKIATLRGPSAKLDLLFSENMRSTLEGNTWYPLMRLILPDVDRERPKYGLKESSLAKIIVAALGLNPTNSSHANQLLKWKDPGAADAGDESGGIKSVGSLPNTVKEVLDKRGFTPESQSKKLRIGQINTMLDELHHALGAHTKQQAVMQQFIDQCNTDELFWLMRIILKDMHIGLKVESCLNRFHPDAILAMESTGDLRKVMAELYSRSIRKAYTAELHAACSVMLADRRSMDKASEGLGEFIIETKLDGDRMLVHMDRTVTPIKWKLVTRNGTDYTERYGSPTLFKILDQALHARRCIVDGEMLSWDSELGGVLDFGQSTTTALEMQSMGEAAKRWLYYKVFDILYLDDGTRAIDTPGNEFSVTHLNLATRRELLSKVVHPVPLHVEICQCHTVTSSDPDERHKIIMELLDQVIRENGEGLVLKSLASPYFGGEMSRKKAFWIKVKPEYVNGLMEEIDLLVLGGYFAEGQRRASSNPLDASSFLIGVQDAPEVPGARPRWFWPVGKVGSGFSLNELADIREHLRPSAHRMDLTDRPAHFDVPLKRQDIPDVWYDFDKSLVFQVGASELVSNSDSFTSGINLRFPRNRCVRWDKPYYQCETIEALRKMVNLRKTTKTASTVSRLESRQANKRTDGGGRGKMSAPITVLGNTNVLSLAKMQDIVHTGNEFEGKSFSVHENTQDREKVMLAIQSHGGKLLTAQLINQGMVYYIVSSISNPDISLAASLDRGERDFFLPTLIWDVLAGLVQLDQPHAKHYAWVGTRTRQAYTRWDQFGDSFTEELDETGYERVMEQVKRFKPAPVQRDMEEQVWRPLFSDPDDPALFPGNFMRGLVVFFDDPAPGMESRVGILTVAVQAFGARILNWDGLSLPEKMGGVTALKLDKRVTHVVITNMTRVEFWRNVIRKNRQDHYASSSSSPQYKEPHLIKPEWLDEVIEKCSGDWNEGEEWAWEMVATIKGVNAISN